MKEFRRQYEALPVDSQKLVSSLSNFMPPCQVIAFWAVDFEYQFALVIKESDLTADSVRVYGLGPLEMMISQAAAALKDSWFDTVAEPAKSALDKKYKAMVENQLLGVLKSFPQMRLRIPPRELGGAVLLQRIPDSGEYFEWTIFGNMLTTNPAGLAAQIISQAAAPGGLGQPPESNQVPIQIPASEPPPTRPGFISAFFPGIWLGAPHTFTFQEKLDGYFIPVSRTSIKLEYKGRTLTIMLNGLLTMAESDKQTCADLLNEIMCMALFLGVPSTAVRDQDLAEAQFYESGDLAQYSMDLGPRRTRILAKEHEPIREEEYNTYKPLSGDKLREIVSSAEKFTAKSDQSSFARWYIDTHTAFEDPDYERCIIKSWLIIERHVNTMWEEHVKKTSGVSRKAGISKERTLQNLLKWKVITPETYAKLDELRERRNDALHEGSGAARKEALDFLKTAEEITKAALGIAS